MVPVCSHTCDYVECGVVLLQITHVGYQSGYMATYI